MRHNQPLLWTGPHRVRIICSFTATCALRCPPQSVIRYTAGATLQGTLVLAILNVRSSFVAESEEAVRGLDVPDTLQWWLGDQTWRIKTFAVDHDIHTYSLGSGRPGLLELAQQNNAMHYGDVIAEQHILNFGDCMNAESVAIVLANAGLANRLEVATPDFAFWKPDVAQYRSQSVPK